MTTPPPTGWSGGCGSKCYALKGTVEIDKIYITAGHKGQALAGVPEPSLPPFGGGGRSAGVGGGVGKGERGLAVEGNGSANSSDCGVCPGRSECGDVSAALGSIAGGVSGLSPLSRWMAGLRGGLDGRAASAGGEGVQGIEPFGAGHNTVRQRLARYARKT